MTRCPNCGTPVLDSFDRFAEAFRRGLEQARPLLLAVDAELAVARAGLELQPAPIRWAVKLGLRLREWRS